MDKEGLLKLIKSLSISQVEFAILIGVETRTVTRWLKGERKIPAPMKLLCKTILFYKMSVMQILKVKNG